MLRHVLECGALLLPSALKLCSSGSEGARWLPPGHLCLCCSTRLISAHASSPAHCLSPSLPAKVFVIPDSGKPRTSGRGSERPVIWSSSVHIGDFDGWLTQNSKLSLKKTKQNKTKQHNTPSLPKSPVQMFSLSHYVAWVLLSFLP